MVGSGSGGMSGLLFLDFEKYYGKEKHKKEWSHEHLSILFNLSWKIRTKVECNGNYF